MNCLVTGGAGFIGSHLVEALLALGHEVTVYDNFSTGKLSNIEGLGPHLTVHSADIGDTQSLRRAMNGMDVVFHLAASSSVVESLKNPAIAHNSNVNGIFNVVEACRTQSVGKLIFASSAATYGNDPTLPKTESLNLAPVNLYGLSKQVGEQYCRSYSDIYGLETVCMRFFNVFGPRQNPKSEYAGVISRFLDCYVNRETPVIYGDGLQTRDFVYVADIVQALVLAMSPQADKYSVYNVCTGKAQSLLDILAALSKAFAFSLEPAYKPARANDIRHSLGSYDKLSLALGYNPQYDFESGIQMLVDSVSVPDLAAPEEKLPYAVNPKIRPYSYLAS